ncbi:MAG TPA: hypothetical protein VNM48_00450 [Chloroflexota bacterium]|nr:hypothetical protein [Chloroflexota bacterium]
MTDVQGRAEMWERRAKAMVQQSRRERYERRFWVEKVEAMREARLRLLLILSADEGELEQMWNALPVRPEEESR